MQRDSDYGAEGDCGNGMRLELGAMGRDGGSRGKLVVQYSPRQSLRRFVNLMVVDKP